jgi:DNA-binding MarR family transcriptional regulator
MQMGRVDEMMFGFLRMGAWIQREGARVLKEFNINMYQFLVLNEIYSENGLSQKNLVENLNFEKSNVSKIIKKLQELNYIDIDERDEDKRFHVITTTNAGNHVCENANAKMNAWNNEVGEYLYNSEVKSAVKVIQKLLYV